VPSDLNEVAADVVELMTSRAQEKQVELRFVPAERLPKLTFDPEGMHRAILNVVTNAIDACDAAASQGSEESSDDEGQAEPPPRRQGRVEVCVGYDAAGGMASVTVSDNGAGIPADEIDQIFSLFVSHKGGRGTGLGLTVSQKIVKEHGGRIAVASRIGEGSRFTLEIPAVLAEASPSAKLDGKTLV
jgi:signal transduction histidine kinase